MNYSVFKFYSPEDCDFYYNGEYQGHIIGNSDKAYRFTVARKGTYRVRFVNSKYRSELTMILSIDINEEIDIELDFSKVNAPIIQERQRREVQTCIRRLGREEHEAVQLVDLPFLQCGRY